MDAKQIERSMVPQSEAFFTLPVSRSAKGGRGLANAAWTFHPSCHADASDNMPDLGRETI
jgi:hypothetical protein